MPTNVEALPYYPSGWHPWYPFTRRKTLNDEREFYFPPNMLPSAKFWVVNEYDNLTIQTPNVEANMTVAASSLPMLSSMVAGGSISFPVGLNATLSRKQSWLAAGFDGAQVIPNQSPRFGFSIGSSFKHQAYIKLVVTGVGFTGTVAQIIWIQAVSTAAIEFTSNSRLSKFIVHHGKVSVIEKNRKEAGATTPAANKLWIKLFDNSFPASFAGAPAGNIKFYGLRDTGYQSQSFPYTYIDNDWYVEISDPSVGAPNAFSPSPGDFYVLDKPIICDDPQLIHEFDLKLDTGGMYMTKDQRWYVDNQGIGIWINNDGETSGSSSAAASPSDESSSSSSQSEEANVAYVDESQRQRVKLPDNQAQSEWSNENMAFGGNMADGVAIWNATTPKPTTVRLIVNARGGLPTQNYFSNNLVGEYICVTGTAPAPNEWYEIVGHPRLDTIEINNISVTSGKSFMDTPTAKFVTYQQKFWKLTELYSGFGSNMASGALWGGRVGSIAVSPATTTPATSSTTATTVPANTYDVSWTSIEYGLFLFLPTAEITRNGSKTLPERFRTNCPLVATAINGYAKFAGWKAVIGGAEFNIKSMSFVASEGGSSTTVQITATVEGNPSATAGTGSPVYVVFGDRYKNPLGGDAVANSYASINVAVARTTDVTATHAAAQNCLRMTGFYNAGFYELPMPLDVKQRIAIANHSYGVESTETALGVPQVWGTTYAGITGVCYVEHGAKNRQTIFYRDPNLDTLMSVSADPGWSERRQKAMVRCGNSPKTEASAGVPAGVSYLTGMYGRIAASQAASLKGAFAVVPVSGSNSSPYHSQKIQGFAGIRTPLTLKFSLDITSTTAHPVDLPYEAYEPVPANNNNNPSIGMPVAVKSSTVIPSRCGFDEVINGDRFVSLSSGTQLPSITPGIPATDFEFTKMRQVIRAPKIPGCHAVEDGTVTIFYGHDSGKFFMGTASNASKPSVFAIKSDTNVDNWGSPKYNREQAEAGDPAVAAEWERPMMVAYDFDFADSIKFAHDQFIIFGYGYALDASGAPTDGIRKTLFLGCYLISLQGMRTGQTYKCYSVASGDVVASVPEDQSMFYYRSNHAQASSPMYEMKFGQPIQGIPPTPTTTPPTTTPPVAGTTTADMCPERFTKIIGGSDSGAIISGFDLSQEVVAPVMDEDGSLSVYLRDLATDRILRVWSCSAGGVWYVEKDDGGNIIYYASGSSPAAHGKLLFYFGGDTLYCKNLSVVTEGVYNTKQEELDRLPVGIVATNVVGHKIAVNIDPNGRVNVFYLSKSGDVCAAYSQTSGKTWAYLQNW